MNTQDFFYFSVGIGFLVLVGFLSYAAFSLSKTLKKLTSILIKVDDVAKDAEDLKNTIKLGILNLMSMFLKKGKGGDKNGK